jgi:hypothetical protein
VNGRGHLVRVLLEDATEKRRNNAYVVHVNIQNAQERGHMGHYLSSPSVLIVVPMSGCESNKSARACVLRPSASAKELIERMLDGMVVERWVEIEQVEIYTDEYRSLLRAGHYKLSRPHI